MIMQRTAFRTALLLEVRSPASLRPWMLPNLPIILTARRRFHTSLPHRQVAAAATSASDVYPTSHERLSSPGNTQNFLDNQFVDSKATSWIDLHDPATNNLVTRVPQSTYEELNAAVASAQKAFPSWKATSLLHRQQIMFKFVALIRQHWDRLAASITLEQGKTFADAKGDVLRGLQVAETACGITTQLTGEVLEVAKDMETKNYKEPLGVVAAICPFSMYSKILTCTIVDQASACRFPCHDTPMVYPDCYYHWQYPDPQAV